MAIDTIKTLEAKIKEIKDLQNKQLEEKLGKERKVMIGKYEVKRVEVFRKVLDESVVDPKFVKTEVKPNIATINEYKKENGMYPRGVGEVYHYQRIGIADTTAREENKKKLEAMKSNQPQIENPLKDIKWKKK